MNGGREFSVEDEPEAAFQYAAELERASRVHPEAVALASVINERSPGSA
jgi:hypothetical protein